MEEKKKSSMSLGSWFFVFIVLFLTFAFCFMYYRITFQFNSIVAQRNLMLETLIGIETKLSMALENDGIVSEENQTEETSEDEITEDLTSEDAGESI